MNYLLDTQSFIWWMEENVKLDKTVKTILETESNKFFLSVVSVWEMVIKEKIGKLKLPRNWKETIKEINIEIIPVVLKHALYVSDLPLHHKDPFDRMIIAQAISENYTIITSDEKIKKYQVKVV